MFLKESHNHMSCLDECCLVWTYMFHISIESAQRRPCSHENVPPMKCQTFLLDFIFQFPRNWNDFERGVGKAISWTNRV